MQSALPGPMALMQRLVKLKTLRPSIPASGLPAHLKNMIETELKLLDLTGDNRWQEEAKYFSKESERSL